MVIASQVNNNWNNNRKTNHKIMKPIHIKSGIIISKENYDSFLLKKIHIFRNTIIKRLSDYKSNDKTTSKYIQIIIFVNRI